MGKSETVNSVGIDIGTTTTQLVISRLTVKNVAPGTLVPRMEITDKEVVYRSGIHFTPIGSDNLVDSRCVFDIIDDEMKKAGVDPREIDTGAVIITGETAKKENARLISGQVASFAGDFVVATAGGNLESVIAGKGSGACDYSRKHYTTVANIDIGGGTANVGVYKNGKVVDSCCINVGGRLLRLDGKGTVESVADPAREVLLDLGEPVSVSSRVEKTFLSRFCDRMCDVVLECLGMKPMTDLSAKLLMTEPLKLEEPVEAVMVSGGVADYVYDDGPELSLGEVTKYGDVGPLFGRLMRKRFSGLGHNPVPPLETIRATVIGAGAQTVDVSGSTISVQEDVLPLKNIPVVLPFPAEWELDEDLMVRNIRNSMAYVMEPDEPEPLAICLRGERYLPFADLQTIARGISRGVRPLTDAGLPMIVVLEQDCGKVLGQSLRMLNPDVSVICVDQVVVSEGDYIDMGKPMAGGAVVPVVIKTLVFESGDNK